MSSRGKSGRLGEAIAVALNTSPTEQLPQRLGELFPNIVNGGFKGQKVGNSPKTGNYAPADG